MIHEGSDVLVRINSSSLSLIQTCPRKTFYQIVAGWQAKQGSAPLIFGHAIHKALEVFYSHTCKDRDLPVNFTEFAPLIAHGAPAPEDHFLYRALATFVADAQPLAMLPETDARSIASGVWLLTHYFKTYLNDAYVIHVDDLGPFTERRFTVPLLKRPGLSVELFGTIDFALRNEASGEILIGDHKTSSRMGSEFLNRIKPNHQYTGYMFGAREAFGITSEHFMVNGLQVKSKPLTARGGPPTFTRQITRRSNADFAEFRDVIEEAVTNFLRWTDTARWPLGIADACANYGGCQFLDVCSAPNELRQNILESKFNCEVCNAT